MKTYFSFAILDTDQYGKLQMKKLRGKNILRKIDLAWRVGKFNKKFASSPLGSWSFLSSIVQGDEKNFSEYDFTVDSSWVQLIWGSIHQSTHLVTKKRFILRVWLLWFPPLSYAHRCIKISIIIWIIPKTS